MIALAIAKCTGKALARMVLHCQRIFFPLLCLLVHVTMATTTIGYSSLACQPLLPGRRSWQARLRGTLQTPFSYQVLRNHGATTLAINAASCASWSELSCTAPAARTIASCSGSGGDGWHWDPPRGGSTLKSSTPERRKE